MNTKIVIDGIFYQIGRSGIARVWTKLLENWAQTGFASQVVVVDRQQSCPRVPGITYRDAKAFMHGNDKAERQQLQRICDEVGAALFISTYYTFPQTTPSAMLVYDMIPEVLGWNLNEPMWQQKQRSMQQAKYFAAISENSAQDLRKHLSQPDLPVCIAYTGTDFHATTPEQIQDFKARHHIERPYFLISGSRSDYKNVKLFFEAFETLGDARSQYAIVCTGGGNIEAEFLTQAGSAHLQVVILDDQDMQSAYSGATALVYPSLYEGFGLPVLEAMACHCPVITTRASSIPEVGGTAPLYIELDPDAPPAAQQMREHLLSVQNDAVRQAMVREGQMQAQKFSWAKMASVMQHFLETAAHTEQPVHSPACRLCGSATTYRFHKKLLNSHDVGYHQCTHCSATQTDAPHWLAEAYVDQNEQFDTGQVTRSLINAAVLNCLLKACDMGPQTRVVDYGCGSGLLVRTLRDTGVDIWGYDRYSKPRLAMGFQAPSIQGFDVINLCEVVEHFDNPRQAFDEIFAGQPKLVLIQTGISPQAQPDWDYLVPEHGQHIFFLAPKTLAWLCQTYNRTCINVAGFQAFLTHDLAERLLDPATGSLRPEHHPWIQNLLPNLWSGLFSRPYFHASEDHKRLKQAAVETV
jgi:glycosyltransferase involved in cell wall biosynthesis